MMLLEIDPQGEEPIYLQLRRQIIIAIANGELKIGEQLPSVRQLADEIGVNMMTISKAYNLLKEENYLITDRRNGTTVRTPEPTLSDPDQHFDKKMKLLLAEAVLSGYPKEEISAYVDSVLNEFERGEG